MFYEIDVGKHNDKYIKKGSQRWHKVVRGKGQDHSLVCPEFIFFSLRVQRLSRLPVALTTDFKKYKTTWI